MNRIVLIGNGFDLAHGLKTRYEDFINWYWDQRVNGFANECTDTSKDILCTFKHINGNTWKSFYDYNIPQLFSPFQKIEGKKVVQSILNNQEKFNVTFSPFFKRICTSIETKGWVDIENEYYNLLTKYTLEEYSENNITSLNKQLQYLQERLLVYLSLINQQKIIANDKIRDKIHAPIKSTDISIEASEIVKKEVESDGQQETISPGIIMLLSFNYTKTAQAYLREDKQNVVLNYIHGTIEKPESIIFGYGDELDSEFEKLKNLNDNEYLRNVKSIRYMEDDNYRKILAFIDSGPFQVCIMGHSCGNSDRTLLNTLFEHKNCVSIKPYYYIKKNGTDNYLELVLNICRNFTDMKLMRDRVVNKKYCEPLV